MRTQSTRCIALLTALCVALSGALATACSSDEASPTDKACDRMIELGREMRSEGEMSVSDYRTVFAAAWQEAAEDPDSPIADPLDRSIGILDRNTTGYLLTADEQGLRAQLQQIEAVCTGR